MQASFITNSLIALHAQRGLRFIKKQSLVSPPLFPLLNESQSGARADVRVGSTTDTTKVSITTPKGATVKGRGW